MWSGASGVSTYRAPWKSAASACSNPERSLPVSGWPPRKSRSPEKSSRARSEISHLVLPTSVTSERGGVCFAARGNRSRIAPTGVARITKSAFATAATKSTAPSSTAPAARARSSTSGRSTPTRRPRNPAFRSARPHDPPTRPRPTIATRSKGDSERGTL